jgi:hypothetical protein
MNYPKAKELINGGKCPLAHVIFSHCRECKYVFFSCEPPYEPGCRHRKAGQKLLFDLQVGSLFDMRIK